MKDFFSVFLKKSKRPDVAILIAAAISLIGLIAIQIWEYHDMKKAAYSRFKEEARTVSTHIKLTIEKIVSVAERAGKEIDGYTEELNRQGNIAVRMIHGESINAEYEKEDEEQPQNDMEWDALRDGAEREWETKENFFNLVVFRATERCGECHHLPTDFSAKVPPGYILGLAEIGFPKQKMMLEERRLRRHTAIAMFFITLVVSMSVYGIKRVAASMAASEQKISAIIKSAGEGIIVIGSDSGIRLVNHEISSIFGYDEEELIGKSVRILMPEKYRVPHAEGMKRYLSGGEQRVLGKRVELEGLKKDGTIFPIEIRIEETLLKTGKDRFFTAAIRDITERKEAEKALRESEEKFRSAFGLAGIGMAMADIDGRWLLANRSLCEMLGYGEPELLTKTFQELTHPDDLEKDLVNYRSMLEGKLDSFRMEKRYLHKNGSPVWVILNATVIRDPGGKPVYFIAQIQDITERKEAEQALRDAKENAEESNALKDKFVSLVSHDLRGPLGSMLGFLHLVKGGTMTPLEKNEVDMLIGKSIEAGENMGRMIEELLSISRLKTGKMKPDLRFFDLSLLVIKAVSILGHIAEHKGVEIVTGVRPGTRIYADEALLYEVVHNLLSNAVKFCKKGDIIDVFVPEGENYSLVVSDTGTGISSDNLKHLFDYETKTSTTGTAGESGTGLGLPLSREIMEAMGGTISVDSKEGEGSTFRLRLPFVKPLILLLFGDKDSRSSLRNMLGKLNVDFLEAENRQAALEIIQKPPHLLILDLKHPKGEGFKFLGIFKNNPETKAIPVVAIIKEGDMEARDTASRMGADIVINDTPESSDLVHQVRRFIS